MNGIDADGSAMLRIRDLHKTFAKGTPLEHKALQGISLDVKAGEFVCVIGSNGAGKSTLLNAVAGEFPCEHGSIELDGENITFRKEHKRSRVMSRVFQDPMRGTAPHLTVAENIALAYSRSRHKPMSFPTSAARKRVILQKVESLGLDVGLEDKLETPVGQLSGGQRQAVTLLMATIGTPKLLLLDEHTAALDPATAQSVLDLTQRIVYEQNLATLMVTHSIQSALACGSRTIMLDAGKVVLDVSGAQRNGLTPAELMEMYRSSTGRQLDNDELVMGTARSAGSLGLRIAHIGINPQSDGEFEQAASTLSAMLGAEVRQTPVSCMVGSQVEVMKPVGRGAHGHIAVHADNIPEAERFLQTHGFTIDESSRRRAPDGSTHLVYLNEPVCGFDVHLTTD